MYPENAYNCGSTNSNPLSVFGKFILREHLMLAFCDFPGHFQLMLLCARRNCCDEDLVQIRELIAQPEFNWPEMLAVTTHHRLSSLVFETLDRVRTQGVPRFVYEDLQRQAQGNAFEALRCTAEVQRLGRLYAEGGLEFSVLKGVALSQFLFGNANARHVGDIDLLTSPTRLAEQLELFKKAGYTVLNPTCRLTPHRIASYVTFWKDFTLENRTLGFELDLHWRLFNNRFHAANPMLSHACYTTIEVFGVPMRVFSPRDQFIYIAAHGLSDAWTYFKSLADVAAFLDLFDEDDLEAALARAEELGLLGQMSAAIHLSNDWMGTRADSPRLLPATDPIAMQVRERTTESLLKHNFRPHRSYTSPASWLAFELRLVPGIRSFLEVVRRFVWRPRVWKSVDLPDKLFWIYPLVGLLILPRQHTLEE